LINTLAAMQPPAWVDDVYIYSSVAQPHGVDKLTCAVFL